jgi:hypothetical protein
MEINNERKNKEKEGKIISKETNRMEMKEEANKGIYFMREMGRRQHESSLPSCFLWSPV